MRGNHVAAPAVLSSMPRPSLLSLLRHVAAIFTRRATGPAHEANARHACVSASARAWSGRRGETKRCTRRWWDAHSSHPQRDLATKTQWLRKFVATSPAHSVLEIGVHGPVVREVVMRRVLVLLFIAFFGRTAAAGKLAGVAMPESVTVEGKTLVLNGIGIRKATIFNVKVYVAGFYLETKSRSADEIIRSEQVKRLDMVLLRDVDRDDIVDVWRKGLKKNSADRASLKPRFDQFAGWMSDL